MSLGEWVMRLPKFMLTHPQEDGKPLLYHVFASLYAASGSQFRPQKPEKVRCLFFFLKSFGLESFDFQNISMPARETMLILCMNNGFFTPDHNRKIEIVQALFDFLLI